jgi:NAD(P)H dehydrogenase (quinone)
MPDQTTDQLIAVTGASGAVGGRVAARLSAAGMPQRLVVRDARRAPKVDGATVRGGADYGDYEGVRRALEGAHTLLLIPAAEHPLRAMQHATAVDAAVDAGVQRIVYLSSVGAAADATFTLARDHWLTEEHIRAADVRFTFLRMSLYMDFIPSLIGSDGVIRGPAGDGRVAAILREDVAAAAAAVLLAPDGHDGATYDLTGPQAFSLGEAAALMAQATGRDIRFVNETDEEAFASRAASGAPEFEVLGWVTSYQAIRDGSLDVVSPAVRELTGAEPTSLRDYVHEHPESLAPL